MSDSAHPTLATFRVVRDQDVSGVSGTGVVAEGAQFSDGWAVTHWLDQAPMWEPKTDVWHHKGTAPITKVHGHGGATRIVWTADQEVADAELRADITAAFDVPGWVAGGEAERVSLRRRILRALRQQLVHQRVPDEDERRGIVELTDAVMPVIDQCLSQRDRWRNTVGRAFALAHHWQGAHGASMFLVRAAGAELCDALDESRAEAPEVVHSAENAQAGEQEVVNDALRRMLTDALTAEHYRRVREQIVASPEEHSAGMAEVAMRVISICLAAEAKTPATTCSARYTGYEFPLGECIRAAGHVPVTDHTDDLGHSWPESVAVSPVFDGPVRESVRPGTPSSGHGRAYASSCSNPDHACPTCGDCVLQHPDAGGCFEANQLPPNQGPLTGIEVRDPCPYCESCPLIPRWLMADHIRDNHPDVTVASRENGVGIPDRQACPYCSGAPQFLRSELPAHVQEKHARVLAVLASGASLDEQLAEPETRCRLPHEMEV